jgi:hypothetical protein
MAEEIWEQFMINGILIFIGGLIVGLLITATKRAEAEAKERDDEAKDNIQELTEKVWKRKIEEDRKLSLYRKKKKGELHYLPLANHILVGCQNCGNTWHEALRDPVPVPRINGPVYSYARCERCMTPKPHNNTVATALGSTAGIVAGLYLVDEVLTKDDDAPKALDPDCSPSGESAPQCSPPSSADVPSYDAGPCDSGGDGGGSYE